MKQAELLKTILSKHKLVRCESEEAVQRCAESMKCSHVFWLLLASLLPFSVDGTMVIIRIPPVVGMVGSEKPNARKHHESS